MDNKELRAGTTLYLPVFNEGALFFAGDGHAVQGDGEVCITALETGVTSRCPGWPKVPILFSMSQETTGSVLRSPCGCHKGLPQFPSAQGEEADARACSSRRLKLARGKWRPRIG